MHDSTDAAAREVQQHTAKRHIDPQRAKLRRRATTHPKSRSSEFQAESGLKARMEKLLTLTQKYSREARGVMSSELEQITLKATRPDDMPVKVICVIHCTCAYTCCNIAHVTIPCMLIA
jgi:hypothetical protein